MSQPRVLVVQHTESEDAGRLGEWLAGAGLTLQAVRPYAGEPMPTDLDGYAGLLVLGGPQAAYPDERGVHEAGWLVPTQLLLRRAVATRTPTLAICLGAQLLAEACGGAARHGANGPEIGARLVAKRDVAAGDPLFGPVPFTPDVLQWHHDEISELPAGAVLLASSPAYPHQAFRLGERAWGLQFHIETTAEQVAVWAEEERSLLTGLGIDVDAVIASVRAVSDDLEEAWRPFAERFAALVAGAA